MRKTNPGNSDPSQIVSTPDTRESSSPDFYQDLAYQAAQAGHHELAGRLGEYATSFTESQDQLYDPDWVIPTKSDAPLSRIVFKHISRDSELFQKGRVESQKRDVNSTEKDWKGELIVEEIRRDPLQREEAISAHIDKIEDSKSSWLKVVEEDNTGWIGSKIAEELADLGLFDYGETYNAESLVERLRDLTHGQFYSFLEHHIVAYKEEATKMLGRFVEYEIDFHQKLNEYISNGTVSMTPQEARERLERVTILPEDIVDALSLGHAGVYQHNIGNMRIATGLPPETERNTYFHERLHSISGETAVYVQEQSTSDDNQTIGDPEIFAQRNGVHFTSYRFKDQFEWLNEATTTELADQMAGIVGAVSYPEEQKLKNLLLTSGKSIINNQLVLDAYFEEYEPNVARKVPAWRKFYKAVNAAHRPGFLVELDKVVQEKGVAAGIEFVHAQPKKRKLRFWGT